MPSTGIVTCYWWLFFWLEKHSAQYWYCNMLLVVVFWLEKHSAQYWYCNMLLVVVFLAGET